MRQHQRARILTAVLKSHPDVVNEVMQAATPSLRDTSLLPDIYKHYNDTNTPLGINSKDAIYNHKIIFISSILNLYDPTSLYHNCIVTGRICTILADVMGYTNRQSVSELVGASRAYIKNPSFREKVERVCIDVKGRFQDAPSVGVGQFSLFDTIQQGNG